MTRIEIVIWSGLEFIRLDLPAVIQTFRGDVVELDQNSAIYIQRFERLNKNKAAASRIAQERRQLVVDPRNTHSNSRTVVPAKPVTPANRAHESPQQLISPLTVDQMIAERERCAKAISDLAAVTTLFVNSTIAPPGMIGTNQQLPTPDTDKTVPTEAVRERVSCEQDEEMGDEEIDDEEMDDGLDPPPSWRLYQCGVATCNDTFLDRAGLE
ncbi:unnamed protein product, partial [Penicillium bialowiezense]